MIGICAAHCLVANGIIIIYAPTIKGRGKCLEFSGSYLNLKNSQASPDPDLFGENGPRDAGGLTVAERKTLPARARRASYRCTRARWCFPTRGTV